MQDRDGPAGAVDALPAGVELPAADLHLRLVRGPAAEGVRDQLLVVDLDVAVAGPRAEGRWIPAAWGGGNATKQAISKKKSKHGRDSKDWENAKYAKHAKRVKHSKDVKYAKYATNAKMQKYAKFGNFKKIWCDENTQLTVQD